MGVGTNKGTFDYSRVDQLHPEVVDWQQFVVFMVDVNNDQLDDIIWNHPAATNRIYVGLAK